MTALAGIAALGAVYAFGTSPIALVIMGACVALVAVRDAIKGDN